MLFDHKHLLFKGEKGVFSTSDGTGHPHAQNITDTDLMTS